jgi:hypothetical protein
MKNRKKTCKLNKYLKFIIKTKNRGRRRITISKIKRKEKNSTQLIQNKTRMNKERIYNNAYKLKYLFILIP